MKTLPFLIILLALTIPVAGQRRVSYGFIEISKAQFDTCRKTNYLTLNSFITKRLGKLNIPVNGAPAKLFEDDNSEENFQEFTYLGDIKGTMLSLVKRTEFNSEEYYLVNRTSGMIDTLIGEPVFAPNMRDFACISNPGTDERQRVQICEIKDGTVNTRLFLRGKSDSFLEYLACISRNFILTKDSNGKYWKLNFRIDDD